MKKAGKAVVLMTALAVTGALLGAVRAARRTARRKRGRPKRERRKLVRAQRIPQRRKQPGEMLQKEL